jgi:translation initiation factor 2 beta subunit (eIF-2beta)/eIF-5
MNNDEFFNILLENLYSNLNNSQELNQILIDKPILKMEPKRTMWTNIYKICQDMNRNEKDVIKFISEELQIGHSWATNKDDGVIFCDRIKEKNLLSILKKYFNEFVKCKTCGKTNTILSNRDRDGVFTQTCLICKSINYIQKN